MKKFKTKREFLNDDPSFPGAIITEYGYSETEGKLSLDTIYLTIGDCNRNIQLDFDVYDWNNKSQVKKSLKKVKRIQTHINDIIQALEELDGS